MAKPWYQSQTIVNATSGVLIAIASITYTCIEQDRKPTQAEVGTVLTLVYTLKQTIQGRLKAEEKIGKKEEGKIAPAATIQPDFEAISKLPSAEYPEEDTEELDFDINQLVEGKARVLVKRDTYLKAKPLDSTQLTVDEVKLIEENIIFSVDGWAFCDTPNGHLEITRDGEKYYLYDPHVDILSPTGQILDTKPVTAPKEDVKPSVKKTPIKLPGFTSQFYLEDFIAGTHFTWAEAFRNGERMPTTKAEVDNVINVARQLNKFRAHIGNKPLIVTSWLRPVAVNRAIGGARNSTHIKGHAVDFYCPQMDIWELQRICEGYWKKHNLGGFGRGAKKKFIHVDLRGYFVSWDY